MPYAICNWTIFIDVIEEHETKNTSINCICDWIEIINWMLIKELKAERWTSNFLYQRYNIVLKIIDLLISKLISQSDKNILTRKSKTVFNELSDN